MSIIRATTCDIAHNGGRQMRTSLKPYKTIVIDPPWFEAGGGKIKRGADRHYPLIRDFRVMVRTIWQADCFDPDPEGCHLYCWVTNNKLPLGLDLVKALGFRYVTNICWSKPRFGLGQYFRGQHEICLFGVMGKLPAAERGVSTLIEAPRGRHSAKPEAFFEAVERVSPPPRLEMFARLERPGWDVWGNEV